MKRLIFTMLIAVIGLVAQAQWVITPRGVLTDSITGKPYMVIEREGSKSELYNSVLRNIYLMFPRPKDKVSAIEDEIIVVTGKTSTSYKRTGIVVDIEPEINVIIRFKPNRMMVSAEWISLCYVSGGTVVTPYEALVNRGSDCFNDYGEVKNESRYRNYNNVSSDFIKRIVDVTPEEDW